LGRESFVPFDSAPLWAESGIESDTAAVRYGIKNIKGLPQKRVPNKWAPKLIAPQKTVPNKERATTKNITRLDNCPVRRDI
jgi:hypothetical protein